MSLLNFEQSGQGPALILLHGLFGSLDNLKMISRPLSDYFSTINIDLPDHGLSPQSEFFSYQAYSDAVFAVMDHLQLQSAHILGHSMGGKVAMQMALTHPARVDSLTIGDIAPVNYAPRHDNVFAALNAVPLDTVTSRSEADAYMAKNLDDAGTRQFLLKSLEQTEQGWRWRFNLPLLQRDYSDILQAPMQQMGNQYAGPTLFIKGADSDYIQAAHRNAIEQLFPAAKARIMAGCGHWLHAQKPAEFSRFVRQHIDASMG